MENATGQDIHPHHSGPPARHLALAVILAALCAVGVGYFIKNNMRTGKASSSSPQADINRLQSEIKDLEGQIVEKDNRINALVSEMGRFEKAADLERQKWQIIWRPVFVDDFSQAKLKENWKAVDGDWKVENGKLASTSITKSGVMMIEGVDFSGDFQISYECRTLKSYNGKACDASFMSSVQSLEKVNPHADYLFRFGSYDNTWSGLTRAKKDLLRNKKVVITPGKTHVVVIQRTGNWLSMTVDNLPVFLVEDMDPITDKKNKYGGLYVYRSMVEFDNIVVSKPVSIGKYFKGGQKVSEGIVDPKKRRRPPPPKAKPMEGEDNDKEFF